MDILEILGKHFKDVMTEEVSTEIKTMFEALVESRVKEDLERATTSKMEELSEQNTKDLKEWKEELVEKLNDYTNLTVKDFLMENEEVITENIKANTADKLMGGMMELLKECYIQIPETEVDVVKDLKSQLDTMKEDLNEATNKSIDSDKQIFEYEKAMACQKILDASDLTESQNEKVLLLAENMSFGDIDDVNTKFGILVESVKDSKADVEEDENDKIINENIEADDSEKPMFEVDKYFGGIAQ